MCSLARVPKFEISVYRTPTRTGEQQARRKLRFPDILEDTAHVNGHEASKFPLSRLQGNRKQWASDATKESPSKIMWCPDWHYRDEGSGNEVADT